LSEPHPFCGVANAPVDDQRYVDGSGQLPLFPDVVGIVVGVERDVGPPPAAGGDADDDEGRVPLGVWLVATLPPAAAGLPGVAVDPGPEESPVLVGAVPVAVLDDVAPVSPGGVVTRTAMPTARTEATTTAAPTTAAGLAAGAVRHRDVARRGMDMSMLSFSRCIWPDHSVWSGQTAGSGATAEREHRHVPRPPAVSVARRADGRRAGGLARGGCLLLSRPAVTG
jgi:hypothetical protein